MKYRALSTAALPMATLHPFDVFDLRRLPLFVLLIAVCAFAVVANAADPERIVVTNTHLADRDTPSQDVAVNLLIVNGKLSVVTKDTLVIEPGDTGLVCGQDAKTASLDDLHAPTDYRPDSLLRQQKVEQI